MKTSTTALTTLALCWVLAAPASASNKRPKEPAGTKVISGAAFDIFVERTGTKPFGIAGSSLSIFATTVVVHDSGKHGRQLIRGRAEAIDADLLDASMWQVGDFDGDGHDDYRAVSQIAKKGCRVWATQTWLPDRERFTFAAKIVYLTDARGQPVKNCR